MNQPDRVKLVYVAGRYSASSDRTIAENVEAARAVARRVAAAHPLLFPVVPHQLNAGLEGVGDYEWWLAGTLELMRRCDAVVMVTGWEGSRGACAEREEALRLGMPVFVDASDDAHLSYLCAQLRALADAVFATCAKCGRRAACEQASGGVVLRPTDWWDFSPWSLVGVCRECSHDESLDD